MTKTKSNNKTTKAAKRKPNGANGRQGFRVLDYDQVKRSLIAHHGAISHAAKNLGVHRSTVAKYISEHEELASLRADFDEELLDDAEKTARMLVREGDGQMTRFILERRGQDRGYGKTMKIDSENNTNITHGPDLETMTEDQLIAYQSYLQTLNVDE